MVQVIFLTTPWVVWMSLGTKKITNVTYKMISFLTILYYMRNIATVKIRLCTVPCRITSSGRRCVMWYELGPMFYTGFWLTRISKRNCVFYIPREASSTTLCYRHPNGNGPQRPFATTLKRISLPHEVFVLNMIEFGHCGRSIRVRGREITWGRSGDAFAWWFQKNIAYIDQPR